MLVENFPFQLEGFEEKNGYNVSFSQWNGNGFVKGKRTFNSHVNNINDETITSINASVYSLYPYLMFLTHSVPNWVIVDYVKETYDWQAFSFFASHYKDFLNDPNEKNKLHSVTKDDCLNLIGSFRSLKIDVSEEQTILSLSGKKYVDGQSIPIKSPPINIFNELHNSKSVGLFYYEAIAYELKQLQSLMFKISSTNVKKEAKQLNLFKRGDLVISMGSEEGERAEDDLPFENMLNDLEEEVKAENAS